MTASDTAALCRKMAQQAAMPDGEPCLCISEINVRTLARETGLSLRELEIAALDADVIPERYVRNFKTWDAAGQKILLQCRAALVGLGGLGGNVLEILVRAGVGRIAAADGDVFEASNLNRQVLCEPGNLGQPKSKAAAQRAGRINPAVEFTALAEFLDQDSMQQLVAGADVVVDCLGGLKSRNMLRQACARSKVPLVTAAVAGRAGFAALILPGEPEPQSLFPDDPQASSAELGLGCPAPAVALAAALQGSMALDLILGKRPMRGDHVLYFDLKDMEFMQVGPA